jgi:CRP/FNR family transcriptional regulator
MMEFTTRLATLTGGRAETRFAQLFLKLADQVGKPGSDGVFIPIELSRQELAELTATTTETSSRIMSRWSKDSTVETVDRGFVVLDPERLRELAAG